MFDVNLIIKKVKKLFKPYNEILRANVICILIIFVRNLLFRVLHIFAKFIKLIDLLKKGGDEMEIIDDD